jgi:hypothetical protein
MGGAFSRPVLGFAGAGRPAHQHVMTARGGDFQSALEVLLSFDFNVKTYLFTLVLTVAHIGFWVKYFNLCSKLVRDQRLRPRSAGSRTRLEQIGNRFT